MSCTQCTAKLSSLRAARRHVNDHKANMSEDDFKQLFDQVHIFFKAAASTLSDQERAHVACGPNEKQVTCLKCGANVTKRNIERHFMQTCKVAKGTLLVTDVRKWHSHGDGHRLHSGKGRCIFESLMANVDGDAQEDVSEPGENDVEEEEHRALRSGC